LAGASRDNGRSWRPLHSRRPRRLPVASAMTSALPSSNLVEVVLALSTACFVHGKASQRAEFFNVMNPGAEVCRRLQGARRCGFGHCSDSATLLAGVDGDAVPLRRPCGTLSSAPALGQHATEHELVIFLVWERLRGCLPSEQLPHSAENSAGRGSIQADRASVRFRQQTLSCVH
jgi:hypothetical protein